jgi:hypothetical protein
MFSIGLRLKAAFDQRHCARPVADRAREEEVIAGAYGR